VVQLLYSFFRVRSLHWLLGRESPNFFNNTGGVGDNTTMSKRREHCGPGNDCYLSNHGLVLLGTRTPLLTNELIMRAERSTINKTKETGRFGYTGNSGYRRFFWSGGAIGVFLWTCPELEKPGTFLFFFFLAGETYPTVLFIALRGNFTFLHLAF